MPPSGLYLTPLPASCISSTRSRESQTRRRLTYLEPPRQGRPQAGARGPGKQVARARALERGGAWRQQNQTATFWFQGILPSTKYYLRGDPKGRAPGDQHRTVPNAHPTVP